MSGAPLRVAVLGAGTVGHEVACALLERAAELRPADGAGARARRPSPSATWPGPRHRGLPADLLTDAPAHLVADDSIDVIVELMGGDEPAHTLIAAALAMGKAVVTANKHVIAHHGAELEADRPPERRRAPVRGGGRRRDPGPRAARLRPCRPTGSTRVRGIVNGTTNFILTAMTDADAPLDYATALAEAQRLGYAEADPSGDVEGLDAVNKLVILARLAFGRWLDPADIPTPPDRASTARPARGSRPSRWPTNARPRPSAGSSGSWRPRPWTPTGRSRPRSCRRPCRSTRRSGGRPASATGSRSTP